MQNINKDFISKIERLTDKIKSKVKELEPEIKKLRKSKLDTKGLSILYNKEGFEPAIFGKLYSKKVYNKLVIQTKFHKKFDNKLKVKKT